MVHFLFLLFTALLHTSSINGRVNFKDQIPNGQTVIDDDHAFGHVSDYGGGPLSAFGLDFSEQKFSWSKEFCSKDSDNDGLTNGQELGDPCCKWSMDNDFEPIKEGLSHPGKSESTTKSQALVNPNCGGDITLPVIVPILTPEQTPSPVSPTPTPPSAISTPPIMPPSTITIGPTFSPITIGPVPPPASGDPPCHSITSMPTPYPTSDPILPPDMTPSPVIDPPVAPLPKPTSTKPANLPPGNGSTWVPMPSPTANVLPTYKPTPAPLNPGGNVSVCGDAIYHVDGPVCAGKTGNCPKKGDVAVGHCFPNLKSWDEKSGTCIAPEDGVCVKLRTGVEGCMIMGTLCPLIE